MLPHPLYPKVQRVKQREETNGNVIMQMMDGARKKAAQAKKFRSHLFSSPKQPENFFLFHFANATKIHIPTVFANEIAPTLKKNIY